MCLHNNLEDLAKFLKSKSKNKSGKIIVWKIIFKDEEGYNSSIYNHKWKNGLNISNTERKTISTKTERIDRGFHVYLSREQAEKEISGYLHKGYRLMKCVANIKDLIAVNLSFYWTKQAVFSKLIVKLPK